MEQAVEVSSYTRRQIPFFDYPRIYGDHQKALNEIFRDVGQRGAFILQKDLKEFESNLAAYAGVRYAVGLGNATDALILAFHAAGLERGDEAIFSSHTFVATAGAIHFAGGVPVPADARLDDHMMDPKSVARAVTSKTKFLVPTQLNGRTCNMEELQKIADQNKLKIIEDAAQGLGSRFRGKMAGSFGEASCISFYPAKNLGALGDAGALLTNNAEIFEKAMRLRDHGRDPMTGEVTQFGYNMRMDNLQAAFLNYFLKNYDQVIQRRRQVAQIYQQELQNIEQLHLPPAPNSDPDHFDIYQNYEIQAENRDTLREYLKENGVGTIIQWAGKAVHQFAGLNLKAHLPQTDLLFTKLLLLPMNLFLSDDDVVYIAKTIRKFYAK